MSLQPAEEKKKKLTQQSDLKLRASNQGGRAMAKPRGGGGGGGLLDLEGHYAFYGAYHSNPVNVGIHELFVWPIFLTALMLLHLTAPSAHAAGIGAAVYAAYYFLLDRRAGALAALLCYLCWAASGALAARLGFSVGWKVRGKKRRPFPSILDLARPISCLLCLDFYNQLQLVGCLDFGIHGGKLGFYNQLQLVSFLEYRCLDFGIQGEIVSPSD